MSAVGAVSVSHDVCDLLDLPEAYRHCELCPRRCGADRLEGQHGVCGADGHLLIARAALHFWEEPPLSGTRGSGAIFFSNCSLKCIYCQNASISAGGWGIDTDAAALAAAMLDLQAQGAHNINLVTAGQYLPHVCAALEAARTAGLTIPAVYNTSAYELPEAIHALAPYIQIWLPDFKYASDELAGSLSHASDYPEIALAAIAQMIEEVERAGGRLVDDAGIMQRGIIVRHLVLPGHIDESLAALDMLWEHFGNTIDLSVMNQYTPPKAGVLSDETSELGRPLSTEEYETVLDHADDLGFDVMWWQQGGTVSESFIPAFDGTGIAAYEVGGTR